MTENQTKYNELIAKYRDYSTLGSVAALLQWDMQTVMPPRGGNQRANQLALLSGIMHNRITDKRIGELLSDLEKISGDFSPEQQANLREIGRDYRKATKVPQELVEELSRHESLCHEIWVKAREANRFEDFAPALEKMVELTAKQAEYLGYQDTPLDALIDQFEPYATTAMFTKLFDDVKKVTIPLLNKILASPVKPDTDFLKRDYPTELQKKFGLEVMKQIGFNMERGRLDIAVHPFCTGSGDDVRITTRYNPHAPQQALFGIIHESGHAMYEQGMRTDDFGTPLSEALSLGIHESQSRMWENYVGRGRPFWVFFFPKLQATFPEALKDVTLDQFLLAVNNVKQSLVRVEADEMTYDLHIIIRFEIERDLFAGKIRVMDLPNVWNDKMEAYLGVVPPNNGKEGVLQDIHWSGGMFGYFPTYSLGNIAAAQFWATMRRVMPDMDAKMEQGDFSGILGWLRQNVHAHGRMFPRDELLKRATGKVLGTEDYAQYLNNKYSKLYGL